MSFLKTKESGEAQVDFDRLPRHVAIIMDGNGRWAKRRGLPRTAGHAAGAETFRSIATYCQKIGLEYLTVYAFSTENWKRPLEEVSAIVGLLKKYLLEAIGKRLDSGAKRVTIHLPYDKGGILDQLYQEAKVEQVEYAETIDVVAVCTPKTIGQLGPLVEGWQPHKEPWED